MCQLTFVSINDKRVKRYVTSAFLTINTLMGNKDGFGIFNGHILWKITDSGTDVIKLYSIVDNSNMLMMHVRLASTMYKNSKKAHPFDFGNIVIAHNGTLKDVPGVKSELIDTEAEKDMIDSEKFGSRLSKAMLQGKSLIEALNEVLQTVYGKFAFLIYVQSENAFYCVKNDLADLHIAPVTLRGANVGFVINTEDESFGIIDHMFNNMGTGISFGKIKKLENLKVFKIGENWVEEVGTVVESGYKDITHTYNYRSTSFRSAFNDFDDDYDYSKYGNYDIEVAKLFETTIRAGLKVYDVLNIIQPPKGKITIKDIKDTLEKLAK